MRDIIGWLLRTIDQGAQAVLARLGHGPLPNWLGLPTDDEVAALVRAVPCHWSLAALDSYGTTLTFSSGFCAQIYDVNLDPMKRKSIGTSHLNSTSGWMTFIASKLQDPGGLKLSIAYDGSVAPPITSAAETITLTFSNGHSISCSGY